jgi:PAS domain S-box-containing protein
VKKPRPGERTAIRAEAEARFARAPPATSSLPPSQEIQHELQVHQIELEMQNEELRQVKVALEEARDRYLELYDLAPIGYLTVGDGEVIEAVNLAAAALLGLDRARLRGRRFASVVVPECGAAWRHFLSEVRGGGGSRDCDLSLQRGDGLDFEAHLTGRRDEASAAVRLVLTDVTAQRRDERALRESKLRLSLVLEGSEEGAWDWLVGETFITVSRRWREIVGAEGSGEESTCANQLWMAAIHPEDSLRVRAGAAALVQGSLARYDFEYRLQVPDGGWRWVRSRGRVVVRHPDGTARRVSGTLADITERKEGEAALRRSQDRFRALIDKGTDLIVVVDGEGRFLFVSPSATECLGWADMELVGKTAFDLVHPEDLTRLAGIFTEGVGVPGATGGAQFRARHRDGSWRLLEATGRNLLDDQAVQGVVINARDVTEQHRLEEQVQATQKLESVGRLAGGVAHDFNNLLTVVLSGVEELKRNLEEKVPVELELVEDIGAAGVRARNLTRQLLAFARKQVVAPVATDLNEVVRGAEAMLRRVLREDVELKVTLQPGLWRTFCDPGQMEQVLMNLVVNSRDAIAGRGTLAIETQNSDVPLAEDPEQAAGQWVRLVVRDSGAGMSAEVKAHLFEPFFTTKEQGKGTGLGLATIHGIVHQGGGHLHVRSEPGQGSTFVVCLPRHLADAAPVEAPAPVTAAARGSESILVVEDEPSIRKVVLRVLQGAGYRVVLAPDGAAVRTLGDEQVAGLRLLLTDIIMPGLSGVEVAQEVRLRHPGLPVLYMSGYAQDAFEGNSAVEAGAQVLPKPFTPAVLLSRVRALLDGE